MQQRKSLVVTLVLLALSACVHAIDMDAISKDTAKGSDFPPAMSSIIIDSAGCDLYGIIYMAEGEGPHPTAILLHGFPGNEKMLDLAQTLRRAGINTVFFGYRGAWGSNGDFSYSNCIEDAVTAVRFLKEPANTKKYRIDPDELIVMGHSMGGFVCMNVARQVDDVKNFVYFSGWNVGAEAERLAQVDADGKAKRLAGLAGSSAPLKGTSPEALWDEIISMKDTHNLVDFVPDLAGKNFLMVAATKDTACPIESDHTPLYEALKAAYPKAVEEFIVEDDHVYSATRMEVTRGVMEWLGKLGY